MWRKYFLLSLAVHACLVNAQDPTSSPVQKLTKPLVLQLERQVSRLGDVATSAQKTIYFGKMRIGDKSGQEMRMHFETGSGSVVLDSTRCDSPACLRHRQYSPATTHGVDVNQELRPVSPGKVKPHATLVVDSNDEENGSGSITGNLLKETVCLADDSAKDDPASACFGLGLIAATNMTDTPFDALPYDGIVGLGLEGLSISGAFHFLGRFAQATGLPALFALHLPPAIPKASSPDAELTLGGYMVERIAGPLNWVPVTQPSAGYWQVAVAAIRVGDQNLLLCGAGGSPGVDSCVAVVDSGSSHLSLPAEWLPELRARLTPEAGRGSATTAQDCSRIEGPPLHFELLNGPTLTLTAREYLGLEGAACEPQLHALPREELATMGRRTVNHKVTRSGFAARSLILGEPLLRRFYTVFDADQQRIGFGLSASASEASAQAGRAPAARPPAAAGSSSLPAAAFEETEEVMVLQRHAAVHAKKPRARTAAGRSLTTEL